jgi:hypothetical protein
MGVTLLGEATGIAFWPGAIARYPAACRERRQRNAQQVPLALTGATRISLRTLPWDL